jgi:site-specific DNA recombinase
MQIQNPLQVNSDEKLQALLTIPMKYVLYARKSSESDERQALSIDAQIKEMLEIAERENLEIIDIRRESHSAKDSGHRPVFNEIIKDLRAGRFNGIIVWHPDRLSRNAGDLGSLVDLMDQKKLIEIKTYGQKFTNSPSEKFLLMILCSQAKLENDNKSVNVRRGLRMRCEMGLWPCPAPTGYLNEKRIDRKGEVMIDPERGPIIRKMFEKVAYEKWSGRKIYHWLKFDMNFKSITSGKTLTLSNIYKLLQTPFYYGKFEYPSKSGNWYQGKHEPLISEEVYFKVQEHLKRDKITRGESKEFAFTRLIKCGLCDSGVNAEEKFKKLKNGKTIRYVYYGCNRSKDRFCKCNYIREEELIKDLMTQIDNLEINDVAVKKKFQAEFNRATRFQKKFMGKDTVETEVSELDIKGYVKHVLSEGSIDEKRELLGEIKNKLVLKEKRIILEKETTYQS